jgi:hypothetical protein
MKIDLTDREIELMMMCLGTNIETIKQRHTVEGAVAELIEELFELETDLREALHRQDDGWGDPDDPDLLMDPVDFAAKHDTGVNHDRHIAETQMFNAGVEAREKMKATSRAAGRRALKFVAPGSVEGMKGNRAAPKPKERSEVQDHDVWSKPPNDPVDW